MTTIFLAVTGAQGSGKSVFTNIAKDKYNIPTYRLGNIIIKECKKRGLEINGRNMGKMSSVLRYEGGKQVIASKAISAIQKDLEKKPKLLIIDGIRSYEELSYFREKLNDVRLVAIMTSLKKRKQRVENRKRIDLGTLGDFEEREQRELAFGLGDVITKADYFILNENINKEEFVKQIESLLKRILDEK
ncbi:MAG: AAA family ATPase [Candidatus Heimdallarchaeota archaeon]